MRLLLLIFAMLSLPTQAQEKTGAEVYQSTCIECHGEGKLNAPQFADKKRWKKLVGEGLNDLVPAALRGIRQMPAKGGNPALSDEEVARAVIFMANAGGGKFAEPLAEDVRRWRKLANRSTKH